MTEKELEKIYNEAYKAVYWTAMQFLKNEADAEDVVQDTFISFMESYGNLEDTGKAVALLKKIAANKCLDRIKLSRTDVADDEFLDSVEAVPEDFLPDSIIESEDARRIVMDIINNSLSEDIRRTLILFYFDEMSTREIAEALGVPEGTVRRRLNFARNKIKKEVEKYENENKTKLFGMAALPFLSKLFMKEAEQVPFKAMPASLTTLSASAQAPTQGAEIKVAASAAKKGTGMINKGLIIGITSAVAVVAAVAVTVAVLSKKPDTEPKKTRRTTAEETSDRIIETTTEETTDSEEPEKTTEEKESSNYEDKFWFVDVTDKATMRKLIDDLIACEPRLNDECSKEHNDVGKRVAEGFDHEYSELGLYSEGRTFNFEYGSERRTDIIKERDHINTIGYNNYQLDKLDGHVKFKVAGYKTVYINKKRPGCGTVIISVYDEDRAKACKDILMEYLKELYKDEIKIIKDRETGGYITFSDDTRDKLAEVQIAEEKGRDGAPGYWKVYCVVYFNNADLMNAASSAKETSETT